MINNSSPCDVTIGLNLFSGENKHGMFKGKMTRFSQITTRVERKKKTWRSANAEDGEGTFYSLGSPT